MNADRDRSAKILLVEDNETIRNAFAILLEDSGYRIEQAGTGAEALDKVTAEKPDLVLMDLGLPDGNGLEITRKLKANPETRDTRVVAVTGRTLETDQAACMEAGCVGFLSKPINTQELLRKIPEFLREPA